MRRPLVRIDADLVHAPSLAIPAVPAACPLLVTVHDLAFLRVPQATTSRGVRFHARGLELARRHATRINVPSDFTRRELVAEGFDPERVDITRVRYRRARGS